MVSLIIGQFKTELRWLRKLERELPRRAAALHPALVGTQERADVGDA